MPTILIKTAVWFDIFIDEMRDTVICIIPPVFFKFMLVFKKIGTPRPVPRRLPACPFKMAFK